jgi:hypothetical protein
MKLPFRPNGTTSNSFLKFHQRRRLKGSFQEEFENFGKTAESFLTPRGLVHERMDLLPELGPKNEPESQAHKPPGSGNPFRPICEEECPSEKWNEPGEGQYPRPVRQEGFFFGPSQKIL